MNDLCEDTTACNYDANPTEACLYEDAFGVCGGDGFFPELLIGSWQFTTAAGAIAVGPDPYSDAWYSSEANGLQSAQYDDIYTFHADGSLTTDYNGSIIDAFANYAEVAYNCSSPATQFLPSGGTSGENAFALLREMERARALSSEPTMPVWCMTLSPWMSPHWSCTPKGTMRIATQPGCSSRYLHPYRR